MRLAKIAPIVGVVLCMATFGLAGQGPSPQWRSKHLRGERYEGVGFVRNVTSPVELELISFLAVTEPETRTSIDIAAHESIAIDFYSRRAAPYRIVVRERALSEYYWMEPEKTQQAVLGPNTFGKIWKTDVLRELKANGSRISIDELGGVVWFEVSDDSVTHVAPIVMRAESAKPQRDVTSYVATLLPNVPFDRVSFAVKPGCTIPNTSKPFPGGGSLGRKYPSSAFDVDFAVPSGVTGPVLLEVTTTRAKVDTPVRYCFHHQPGVR